MGYKERQPVERKVIRHGRNRKLIDMSFVPSAVKAPEGGKVDLKGLLQEIREQQPTNKSRRYIGPLANS